MNTTAALTTYHQLHDVAFKEIAYQAMFTASFMLLCSVSNPLFDEVSHIMQVDIELSNGQSFMVHMDYADLIGNDLIQEGMTGRLIQAIEKTARKS